MMTITFIAAMCLTNGLIAYVFRSQRMIMVLTVKTKSSCAGEGSGPRGLQSRT